MYMIPVLFCFQSILSVDFISQAKSLFQELDLSERGIATLLNCH